MRDKSKTQRLQSELEHIRESPRHKVLLVAYARNVGGGAEQHCQELIHQFSDQALFIVLRPAVGGLTCLEYCDNEKHQFLYFKLPRDLDRLNGILRFCNFSLVHFHVLRDHNDLVWSIPKHLAIPYYVTAHDYYFCCANVFLIDNSDRYCGERAEKCHGCCRTASEHRRIMIWRRKSTDFLELAQYVIAPSRDTATRYNKYFPTANVVHAPHLDIKSGDHAAVKMPLVIPNENFRVAILGTLSRHKGADLLEQTAALAQSNNANLRFKLFGSFDRSIAETTTLSIHGQYLPVELVPALTQWHPHVVWFPAQCPETYSYTLSACIDSGLPVVVPNLGAFPERVANRPLSWVVPWNSTPAEIISIFDAIRMGKRSPITPGPPDKHVPTFNYYRDYLSIPKPGLSSCCLPSGWNDLCPPPSEANNFIQTARRAFALSALWIRHSPFGTKIVKRIPHNWRKTITNFITGVK